MFKDMEIDNIFKSITIIYYLTKITGLAPYSVTGHKTNYKWTWSKPGILGSLLMLLILITGIVPIYIFQSKYLQLALADTIYSDFLRTVSNFLMAAIAIILGLVNGRKTCSLMQDMCNIDSDMDRIGIHIDHRAIFKWTTLTAVISYTVLILTIAVDFVVFMLHQTKIMSYVYWYICIYGFLIHVVAITQFTCYLYLLYKRFALINQHLLQIPCISVDNAREKMTKGELNALAKNNKIYNIGFIRNEEVKVKNIPRPLSNSRIVNSLCEMHEKLCTISKEINSMFSIIILMTTTMTFVVLVTQLYYFYLMLSANETYDLTFDKGWSTSLWGFYYFTIMFVISYGCSKTKDKANEASVSLHKMEIDVTDNNLRCSVEMFSLQMFHQKVEFTACGFFPVDFSVLYMVMGAVTTYLVFLIQFEISARNQNKH